MRVSVYITAEHIAAADAVRNTYDDRADYDPTRSCPIYQAVRNLVREGWNVSVDGDGITLRPGNSPYYLMARFAAPNDVHLFMREYDREHYVEPDMFQIDFPESVLEERA